ncbi:MAG TPA: ABC transporter substrate-binding protein [Candidatus Dormibacteraeota bacterium]|nr:ABC transporter substrate-binding protein [Candidatus Dormibacteraeota bacterium]
MLLVVFALAGTAGCSGAQAHLPADTLVALEAGDAPTLSPLYSTNYYSTVYENLVMDPLVNVGGHFQPIPWLATSWSSGPAHLHWTVHLRRGVTFSDGAPFTSKDVVFSYDTYLNPKVGFPYQGQFAYIKKVTALGPYTVRFDLSQTNALFVAEGLNLPILPQHILGKIPPAQMHSSGFGEHPVGTGPYTLVRWRHDDELIFQRNPHWWHGLPRIPRIEIRVVLNSQSESEAMENGNADFYDGIPTSSYALLRGDDPNLTYVHLPDLYSVFLETNDALPGLRDVRVRQAMIYGWDREALVKGLLHGDAIVATGIVPHGLPEWYDPNVKRYPYDPAKARALLEAAGWRMGSGGIRERDGKPLRFTLLMPNAGAAAADLGADYQADMRAIGIAIDVKMLDYATFIEDLDKSDFQIAYTGWGGTTDPDEFTFLDSSQFPPTGNNAGHYVNHAVDRVLRAGLRELNPVKRKALYDRMQVLTAEDPPVIWAYDVYYRAAFSKRVEFNGAHLLPDQYIWNNVWDWSLRP